MSYDALLIHEVDVHRLTGAVDRFGQPVPITGDASSLVGTFACRLTQGSGGERYTDRSRDTVVRKYKLFMPIGVELYESDVVTVRDPRIDRELVTLGNVTDVSVVDDWQGPHHIEAAVEQRRSGDAPA